MGWPEGKRKVSALHILMHKDYENSISSGDVETSMYQRSVLRRIKDLVSLLRYRVYNDLLLYLGCVNLRL